jgi:hypothetical protein
MSDQPALSLPVKVSRPLSQPVDDLNDFPRARHPRSFERHRREAPKAAPVEEEPQAPAFDPVKWSPARRGLGLVFCGWAVVLGTCGLFVLYWLWIFFFHKIEPRDGDPLPVGGQFWLYTIYLFRNDVASIRTIGTVAGCVVALGALVGFAGQCLCITVPAVARARWLVIGSVVGTIITIATAGAVFASGIGKDPESVDAQQPEAKASVPAGEAPKTEPAAGEEAPKVEAPMAGDAAPPPKPFVPGVAIPWLPRLLILAAYFASQVLFIFFLKRVALYFHDVFLADSASAYLALVLTHSLLLALLPIEALVACFFWVILLALQFMLMAWMLVLLAGTRRAIG